MMNERRRQEASTDRPTQGKVSRMPSILSPAASVVDSEPSTHTVTQRQTDIQTARKTKKADQRPNATLARQEGTGVAATLSGQSSDSLAPAPARCVFVRSDVVALPLPTPTLPLCGITFLDRCKRRRRRSSLRAARHRRCCEKMILR